MENVILATGEDVTDARLMKHLVTEAGHCAVLVNPKLEIRWCNEAYARHYGWKGSISALMGRPVKTLWRDLDDEGKEYERICAEMLSDPNKWRLPFKKQQVWKNGKRRWLRGERQIISDSIGNAACMLVHFDDDTSVHETAADQVQQDVLRFLGHALKGKGASVQNWLGSLVDTFGDREELVNARRVVDAMIVAASKATKLAAAAGHPAQEEIHLRPILDRLELQHRESPVLVSIDKVDPSLTLNGHEFLLETAIDELILNAIRHVSDISGGYVKVDSSVTNKQVVLSVVDNGPGVPDYLLDAIFRRNVSGNPSRTGIGLMMVRTIVEQLHGGRIVLESTPDSRTTFRISLPVICS